MYRGEWYPQAVRPDKEKRGAIRADLVKYLRAVQAAGGMALAIEAVGLVEHDHNVHRSYVVAEMWELVDEGIVGYGRSAELTLLEE